MGFLEQGTLDGLFPKSPQIWVGSSPCRFGTSISFLSPEEVVPLSQFLKHKGSSYVSFPEQLSWSLLTLLRAVSPGDPTP